jgi:hypothetical protein
MYSGKKDLYRSRKRVMLEEGRFHKGCRIRKDKLSHVGANRLPA